MWQVLSGVFLGSSLGSNDASNVFGTAVASRMVKFWTAAVLCSVFNLFAAASTAGAGDLDNKDEDRFREFVTSSTSIFAIIARYDDRRPIRKICNYIATPTRQGDE